MLTYKADLKSEDIRGWMAPTELAWLRQTAAKSNSWLEIGCHCGRSTHAVGTNLLPGATLYIVDPLFDFPYYKESGCESPNYPLESMTALLEWFKIYKPDLKIRFHQKKIEDVHTDLPSGLDVAFIDGGHEYHEVMRDIAICKQHVKPGGIISGHDYGLNFPGVIKAVDETFGETVKVPRDTTIWHTR